MRCQSFPASIDLKFAYGIHSNIKDVVEGPPSLLIEHVAERIASSVLNEHRMVLGISVAVSKPHVAIPGVLTSMGMF